MILWAVLNDGVEAKITRHDIQTESITDRPGDDPWRIECDYIGGLIPETMFETIFGKDELSWTADHNNFDETVTAPPVGEPDADPEDWIEYDSRAMADRLAITAEKKAY